MMHLKRLVYLCLLYTSYSNQEMDSFISKGFMISSDVAHGLHPNYPEKNDITNIPILNKGLALKIACSQSYAGDARAIAIVKGLCEEAGAEYQICLLYTSNR